MAFKDIIGQEIAKKILIGAIKNNKLSASYLFYGPEGVGKTLMAKTYAKALNCDSCGGHSYDSCDLCRSCKSIETLINPDFSLVEPLEEKGKKKKNISIDQVREIKIRYSYRSALLKHRVTIIEKADLLSDSAANAFLKILEEPPKNSIFILTTSRINDILPTIRSRCQEVRFRKLELEEIEEFFAQRGQWERSSDLDNRHQEMPPTQEMPLTQAGIIGTGKSLPQKSLPQKSLPQKSLPQKSLPPLQLANGSIKRALRLVEPDFKEMRIRAFKFINSSPLQRVGMVEKFEQSDIREFLSCIQGLYRDLLVKKLGVPQLIKNSDLELVGTSRFGGTVSLLDAIHICEQSFDALERSVNKNFVLYRLAKELPFKKEKK